MNFSKKVFKIKYIVINLIKYMQLLRILVKQKNVASGPRTVAMCEGHTPWRPLGSRAPWRRGGQCGVACRGDEGDQCEVAPRGNVGDQAESRLEATRGPHRGCVMWP